MLKCVAETEKLPGKTIVLVDVSGSMTAPLSRRSEMQRTDAAYGIRTRWHSGAQGMRFPLPSEIRVPAPVSSRSGSQGLPCWHFPTGRSGLPAVWISNCTTTKACAPCS